MCVHAKSARDRQPSIQRSTGRSRLTSRAVMGTPHLAFMSLCKFAFLVFFLLVLSFFLPMPNEAAKSLFQCNRRAREILNVVLQKSESAHVIQ